MEPHAGLPVELNRNTTMAMEPGRELDAWVAEKVMGVIPTMPDPFGITMETRLSKMEWSQRARKFFDRAKFTRFGDMFKDGYPILIAQILKYKGVGRITAYEVIDSLNEWCERNHPPEEPPKYSTDIAAAWEVVEKLRAFKHPEDSAASFVVEVYWEGGYIAGWTWHEAVYGMCRAETAPHAICLAALEAVAPKA